jgi:two-component system, chemotaxis family, sensor kinase CheA
MSEADNEILVNFIEESREHLNRIENDLLLMEESGADIDEGLVNKVFRAAHSIKGGAGFLDLSRIKELAHKIENVLDLVRSRKLVPNPEVINILLLSFDKLREMINNSSESQDVDISDFIVSLNGLTSSYLPPKEKKSVSTMVEIHSRTGVKLMEISELEMTLVHSAGRAIYLMEFDLIHDIHLLGKNPLDIHRIMMDQGEFVDCRLSVAEVGTLDDEPSSSIPFYVLYATQREPDELSIIFDLAEEKILTVRGKAASTPKPAPEPPPVPAAAPEVPAKREAPFVPLAKAPERAAMPAPARPDTAGPMQEEPAAAADSPAAQASSDQAETSLRVNVTLLESLMNLAGELVLSRNQLLDAIAHSDQRTIQSCGQRINVVTSELQEAIMLTRLQPVGNIFNKFPRVVRDLARSLGKDVRLNLIGKEVEMDKTIIEGLGDPLTHLVRNAVDHGIETSEDRIKAGKKPSGTVTLKAFHEAGQINIMISDDGKGMDPAKIASAAVSKGLIIAEKVRSMSEKEMISLIFLPGFSTAQQVTDVSGRGVGMDVVKTNLDKLGGKVEIESIPGKGSTIRIKLPLTLAIIPSLLISAAGNRFAIPQMNVVELIRVRASQAKERIELIGNSEVLVLRGMLIPIIHLADALGIPRFLEAPEGDGIISERRLQLADRRSPKWPSFEGGLEAHRNQANEDSLSEAERRLRPDRRTRASSDLNIVVVNSGVFQYGLVVDELHDTVEIVVKPVGTHLKHLREYAGATILADGKVALILDINGLASRAGLTSLGGTFRAEALEEESAAGKALDHQSFLLFRNAPDESCAVPLDLVERIERCKSSEIETVSGRMVLKRRGASMPLFKLEELAHVKPLPEDADRVVIVFHLADREVGLLATLPVDAVETAVQVDTSTLKQKAVFGTAIIHDRTTMLVDIHDLVESLYPEWFIGRAKPADHGKGPASVLLAEDSDFFRNMVQKYLEEEGYRVLAAADGMEAWELLQKNSEEIRIVVTDIEMPRMDGLSLTRQLRADRRFEKLPVIAVTSLADDESVARGTAAGVSRYQIKLDKDHLLRCIAELLLTTEA